MSGQPLTYDDGVRAGEAAMKALHDELLALLVPDSTERLTLRRHRHAVERLRTMVARIAELEADYRAMKIEAALNMDVAEEANALSKRLIAQRNRATVAGLQQAANIVQSKIVSHVKSCEDCCAGSHREVLEQIEAAKEQARNPMPPSGGSETGEPS